jgi:hypothetical protein
MGRYVPDTIIINLGTNDFGHDSGPAWEAAFSATYTEFVLNATRRYKQPKMPVFVAQGWVASLADVSILCTFQPLSVSLFLSISFFFYKHPLTEFCHPTTTTLGRPMNNSPQLWHALNVTISAINAAGGNAVHGAWLQCAIFPSRRVIK